MRAPFFVLTQNYATLPQYEPPTLPRTYETYTFYGEVFLLHRLNATITQGNKIYDVVFMLPESLFWQQHLYVFRKLRLGKTSAIHGVWVEQDLLDLYPELEDYLLDDEGNPVVPHMIMGDLLPQLLALITYNPSMQDCINNVEPAFEDVFGFLEE